MDSSSIAKAVASTTPDINELLDRHARWSARMCRNVPSIKGQMFQNVPSSAGEPVIQTAKTFRKVPEPSGMFHQRENVETNPIPRPLTYRQLAAARLIVRGRGSLEVARQVGVEHHSVARWKRDPAFRAELERLRSLKTNSAVARSLPARRPSPPQPTAARVAPARAASLRLTKEDLEHEAMIDAYMRAHGF
jgi:hypothetical protein